MQRDSFCSYCGAAFPDGLSWPRVCAQCTQVTYRNPLPVAVVLQPVGDGLLCIQRGITPKRGEWAFPGGFIELHETWQQACVRELFEETGLQVDAAALTLFDVESANGFILIFGQAPHLQPEALPPFLPTEEALDRKILRQPQELAFSLHTRMLQAWLRQPH